MIFIYIQKDNSKQKQHNSILSTSETSRFWSFLAKKFYNEQTDETKKDTEFMKKLAGQIEYEKDILMHIKHKINKLERMLKHHKHSTESQEQLKTYEI